MLKFLKCVKELLKIQSLNNHRFSVVFYSEGASYWPHLEGLLEHYLKITESDVIYISSDENEPCFRHQHSKLKCFLTDKGFVRNWLFENLKADVMVMTMPDLDQYQLKKSKFGTHYIYVHHSIVSSQMIYREHAFDAYDSIFCSGSHHIEEMKAIEKLHNLPEKKLIPHGYGRLDSILESNKNYAFKPNEVKKILVAPSWGEKALIETCGEELIHHLLEAGFFVTLRPHPQSLRLSSQIMDKIVKCFSEHENFVLEKGVSGKSSLLEADIMISDWSGAALDFAFGLNKPVLFIDVPRKVNNLNYKKIELEPLEVRIRSEIGAVLGVDELDQCKNKIEDVLKSKNWNMDLEDLKKKYVFNVGCSASSGAESIKKTLLEVRS